MPTLKIKATGNDTRCEVPRPKNIRTERHGDQIVTSSRRLDNIVLTPYYEVDSEKDPETYNYLNDPDNPFRGPNLLYQVVGEDFADTPAQSLSAQAIAELRKLGLQAVPQGVKIPVADGVQLDGVGDQVADTDGDPATGGNPLDDMGGQVPSNGDAGLVELELSGKTKEAKVAALEAAGVDLAELAPNATHAEIDEFALERKLVFAG